MNEQTSRGSARLLLRKSKLRAISDARLDSDAGPFVMWTRGGEGWEAISFVSGQIRGNLDYPSLFLPSTPGHRHLPRRHRALLIARERPQLLRLGRCNKIFTVPGPDILRIPFLYDRCKEEGICQREIFNQRKKKKNIIRNIRFFIKS